PFRAEHNEKVFHRPAMAIFWKRKRSVNAASYNRFLEMKKYSEKIEKSGTRWHSKANQRSGG
ncbi:hypothetical protein, partial [Mesorhizobium sp. M1A.F.Ca.IN.022.07.1.1]|uniref:hypothetical protein n=1 Tax=Mesorhizobium sp. M1A.F.Ca.IN.022.07.1.1 TaxID=2496767 RepID=UPI0019D27330